MGPCFSESLKFNETSLKSAWIYIVVLAAHHGVGINCVFYTYIQKCIFISFGNFEIVATLS